METNTTPAPIIIQQHMAPKAPGLATAAMILGICTFISFGATGIPALITGILGIRDCRARNLPGDGMAITGIVLGGLACLGWLGWWGLVLLGSVVDGAS